MNYDLIYLDKLFIICYNYHLKYSAPLNMKISSLNQNKLTNMEVLSKRITIFSAYLLLACKISP